jgi:mevalonate kinase
MIKVSAPGNLFFLGEHAVVYGYPSINVSVNKRTYVTILERTDDKVKLVSKHFGEADAMICNGLHELKLEQKEMKPVADVVDMAVRELKLCKGFEIEIESEIPVESGMSSSTAMLAAVFRSMVELSGRKVKNERYYDYLFPLQEKIHGGMASGSEIISSSIGGFNRIQKTEKDGKSAICWKNLGIKEFSIVIGNTLVRAPTALTVGSHVPSLMKRKKEFVLGSFEKIGKLSLAAQSAIKKGNAVKLGSLMNKSQKILSGLMLSHPKIDDCIDESLKAGALGAKLSGGGWGGVMFALVEKDRQESVANAIESTGAEAIMAEIGVEGARVEQ